MCEECGAPRDLVRVRVRFRVRDRVRVRVRACHATGVMRSVAAAIMPVPSTCTKVPPSSGPLLG